MATLDQELEAKALLQRFNIRTMRKDLKQLRENDSVKERTKISNFKIQEKQVPAIASQKNPLPPLQKPAIMQEPAMVIAETLATDQQLSSQPTQPSLSVPILKTPQEKPLPKQPRQPEVFNAAELKNKANEEEKQQLFLFESQKTQLESKLNQNSKQEPLLDIEKNKILMAQKEWQRRLAPLAQDEEKIQTAEKILETKKAASVLAQEKQLLQQQSLMLEDKKQALEKKRWPIEQALAQIDTGIKIIDENYRQFHAKQDSLTSQIADLDSKIQSIYQGIQSQEDAQKITLSEKKMAPTSDTPEPEPQPIKKTPVAISEKPYLKEMSPITKEILAKEAPVETRQRKKFMEDVEKWASNSDHKD